MARLHPSNVKEIASNKPASSATAFNLPDSATAPYRSFDSALATGDTVLVHATNGTSWQDFIGTFTAGTPDTLAQTTLLESSTGSFIDWSAGGDVTLEVAWVGKYGEYVDPIINRVVFLANGTGATAQSLTLNTWTKISTALNATAVTDTVGGWDGTNKKYLPLLAGKYHVQAQVKATSISNAKFTIAAIYKNGALVTEGSRLYNASGAAADQESGLATAVVEMNGTTDYLELYGYISETKNIAAYTATFLSAIYLGK